MPQPPQQPPLNQAPGQPIGQPAPRGPQFAQAPLPGLPVGPGQQPQLNVQPQHSPQITNAALDRLKGKMGG